MRTINLGYDTEALIKMQQAGPSMEKINDAIAYLSTWALDSYEEVSIYRDREVTDMIAVYSNPDNERRYVIGAVWHEDHYGFHS